MGLTRTGHLNLLHQVAQTSNRLQRLGHGLTRAFYNPSPLFGTGYGRFYELPNLLCSVRGPPSQQAHLTCNYRKSTTVLTGTRRLDSGIQCQDVGLKCNCIDHGRNFGNLNGAIADVLHFSHGRHYQFPALGGNPQFNSRIDNAIGFESDSFNGFSVRGYYGANEGKSADGVTGAFMNDTIVSAGAQYLNKGWDIRLSVEQRYDKGTLNATTNRNTTDIDYRLGIRYALTPSTSIAFGMDQMSLADSAATGASRKALSRTGWVSSLKHVSGKSTYYGSYGAAGDITCELGNNTTCDGSNTGADQIVLGYQYQINKQVLFEGFLSQVRNKTRAKYDFDGGAISPGAGATLTAIGGGLRASF